jgi:hypothetical protein
VDYNIGLDGTFCNMENLKCDIKAKVFKRKVESGTTGNAGSAECVDTYRYRV